MATKAKVHYELTSLRIFDGSARQHKRSACKTVDKDLKQQRKLAVYIAKKSTKREGSSQAEHSLSNPLMAAVVLMQGRYDLDSRPPDS